MSKQKIFFITYGTKQFRISAKHIIKLAKKSGFFEECIFYEPKDLSYEFKNEFNYVLSQNKGAGYWVWKHEIINETLKKINNDDIVVYCDAGSSFNYLAKERFFDYIEMLNSSKYGNFRIESDSHHLEKYWTLCETFDYFNLDPESKIGNSPQLEAGEMIFKKNDHTRKYFLEYKQVLKNNQNLITDNYDENTQIDSFRSNRHDQSLFSMLSKIRGCVSIKNETNFIDNPSAQYDSPFLTVRTYGHGYKDRFKYLINYKKKYDTPVFFK